MLLSTTVTMLYIRSSDFTHNSKFVHFFFTKLSLFPPSLTPVNHFSTLFLSSTLFFKKDSTYRWHHFLSIWLILCTVMPSRFILLLQMTGLLPFARLNNILLLVICVYIYIYIMASLVARGIYTPYFLDPICWWTLGCFCTLATMNNVVMNIAVQIRHTSFDPETNSMTV